ncbi:reverse transcriptase [Gossypium australe]|uniref:Reverse transcriptase n=1 Tax=Gossypium australe TaxID=47621 RepID=A0A5B6VBB3_9ROSI|nr:reverse transcriptase [Gossypium australe]
MVINASVNGALLSKSYNEAYEIIERITSNKYQRPTSRAATGRRVVGLHEVDALTFLTAEVSSMSLMLKNFTTNNVNNMTGQPPSQIEKISCEYYGDEHSFEHCPSNLKSRPGPQLNFYNPLWRNHPNFSWCNQGADLSNTCMQSRPNQPPCFNQQTIRCFAQGHRKPKKSKQGSFGKTLEPKAVEIEDEPTKALEKRDIQSSIGTLVVQKLISENLMRKIFQQKLRSDHHPTLKDSKQEVQLKRLGEFETVALTKECSAFQKNKLPARMKDLGIFTIP